MSPWLNSTTHMDTGSLGRGAGTLMSWRGGAWLNLDFKAEVLGEVEKKYLPRPWSGKLPWKELKKRGILQFGLKIATSWESVRTDFFQPSVPSITSSPGLLSTSLLFGISFLSLFCCLFETGSHVAPGCPQIHYVA